jgi:hypothetical protein
MASTTDLDFCILQVSPDAALTSLIRQLDSLFHIPIATSLSQV